ncbi:glycosyltransferase family 2 protein [Ruminococcus flavefaciens]|uniref:glycosyltransferase family 2 protein n=1 Tax=Ruminococcus flavefaciens TaxID=1265 RepID=UPI0006867832|nr:glycosyltransferase family 2 protein [Ruminococcus flavefaciens]
MVSIIIPVYNVEKYLCDCVDSVINQTYKDLEIILVDDGSPDRCGEICDEYAKRDSRIIVIHKKNGGLSDARNAGLIASHGEFIYFLDSDDYIKSDAIEKVLNVIIQEKADIVYFDALTIYDGFDDPSYKESFIRKHCYSTCNGAKVLLTLIKNGEYYPCVPLLFIRKTLLSQNALKFKRGIIHEDELFTAIAYIDSDRAAQLKESLYIRRLRAGSIMSEKNTAKSVNGLISCICGLADEYEKWPFESFKRKALERCIKDKLGLILEKYYILDRSERSSLRPDMQKLNKRMRNLHYLNSRKLMIKLGFMRIYSLYKLNMRPLIDSLQNRNRVNK